MFKSNTFGRAFWVDINNEFRSCPLFNNNEPDLDHIDYVSEWTDLEGLELDKLLNIHRIELINKMEYEGKYDFNDADNISYKNDNHKEEMRTYDEDLYKEIVKDSKFSYGKFNQHNYPIHLQQL